MNVLEEIEEDWKYLPGGERRAVQNVKCSTHLLFTESVTRVSVIRTDQIVGCPFQPEDGFEPDYPIHGLVLKRERGGEKKANYLSLCSKAFFFFWIVDPWKASGEASLSHPLGLALKLLNLISSICHLDTVEKKLFCIGFLDTIQKIICQGHQRLGALGPVCLMITGKVCSPVLLYIYIYTSPS